MAVNKNNINQLIVDFCAPYLLVEGTMNAKEFCEMIRSARVAKYKTAREFYRENSLTCTYAYYSKVEKDTVPEIKIAIEIISKLSINTRKALYAWTRDHLPSNDLKALFSEIDDKPRLSSEQQSPARSLVINRMQARLLTKNPVYWELLVYMSSCFGSDQPTVKEIAKLFKYKVENLRNLLEELYDYGLVDKRLGGEFASKEWLFIPYELEFQPLRDLNFKRAYEQFLRIEASTQFRTTVTCPLLPKHQKIIESKFMALTNEIIDLSEGETHSEAIPYTVGIFSSPRKFGNG